MLLAINETFIDRLQGREKGGLALDGVTRDFTLVRSVTHAHKSKINEVIPASKPVNPRLEWTRFSSKTSRSSWKICLFQMRHVGMITKSVNF